MLVVRRKINEEVCIGDDVRVMIVDHRHGLALGITAPPHVAVHRREVYEAMRREHGRTISGAKNIEPEDRAKFSGVHWYAVRRRDGARCVVWRYVDASGQPRVSCSRGHETTLEDFDLLGPVVWPVGPPMEGVA